MIVLIGKTASGKDSIANMLVKKYNYKKIITYCTRPPRDGEVDGETYHFISSYEFLKKQLLGYFVETTSYNVAVGEKWYYGTSKYSLKDDNGVLIMNPDGLKAIKKIPGLNYTSFYIMCDKKTLKKRLKKRGDNPKEAKRRLKADKKDFDGMEGLCDYTIMNGNDTTPENVAYVIKQLYEIDRKGTN